MSIATKLAKLKTIKQDIKSALEEKGQTPSNVFSTYANNIRAIETGGGDTSKEDGLVNGALTSYSNDRVNSIRMYAFYNIKTLINVELPNVTSIGIYAFYNCTSLTNINLPNVTSLERNVFQNCKALVSVSMPLFEFSSYTDNLFYGCSALKNIYMHKVVRLDSYIFYQCTSLESIDFPLLHTIDNSFCRGCTNLKQVNLPKLMNVYSHAFEDCTLLTNISFPSVTRLSDYCLKNCSKLESVDIGELERIDAYAFSDCYILKSFTILNNTQVANLSSTYAFFNCYHILGTTNSTYNPNGLKDGYIYVPHTLLKQYKVATNWVQFKSQIIGWGDFESGNTLPNYADYNTYKTCKWYSDKELTQPVYELTMIASGEFVVDSGSANITTAGRYYCKLD